MVEIYLSYQHEDPYAIYRSPDDLTALTCTHMDVNFANFDIANLVEPVVGRITSRLEKGLLSGTRSSEVFVMQKNCLLVQPKCVKYISFGHSDNSLRVCNLKDDSHHALAAYEEMHTGLITVADITANGNTLVLGGADSVISVWKIRRLPNSSLRKRTAKRDEIKLLKRLCGHSKSITCVAVSSNFGIIVSGSEDGTDIIWDLNRLTYLRQLVQEKSEQDKDGSPVTAIAINQESGEITVCSGVMISVYTVNGAVLASIDSSKHMGRSPIVSVCVTEAPVYQSENVIITGHQDGTMKFFGFEYGEEQKKKRIISSLVNLRPRAFKNQHKNAVTALHVSADQRKLYSGDESGVVLCWFIGTVRESMETNRVQ
jgi:WD40 repeat protein